MKNKKISRVMSVLFAVLILFTMTACSGKSSEDTAGNSKPDANQTANTADKTADNSAEGDNTSAGGAQTEILISAASSLTDVLNEVAQKYMSENKDIKVTFTFGSSGALQTQIEEGAPSDIFISAAEKQMNALSDKNLIIAETRKDILRNELVLIVPKTGGKDIKSFDDLKTDKVAKIALGDAKSVPAGQYAEEVFTKLGILDKVKAKAVYGSDVRQVLSWVESGDADCGLVYKTDALSSDKVSIAAEAPQGSHKDILYPAAVIKSTKNADAAKSFLNYISSDEALKVFEQYGFTVVK